MTRRLLPLLLVAALLAACSVDRPSTAAPTGAGTAPPSAGASAGPTTAPPSEPSASDAPVTEPSTDEPTEPATEPPTEPADTATPGETPVPGSADACTGTDENREFYEQVAGSVDWTVLCPALPRGWFVGTGSYRLANGGRLVITYKGPGGSSLELSQGAFCRQEGDCVPPGSEVGPAALGPLDGTLVGLDDGRWAVVADRGAPLSWLLIVSGLDQAAATGIAADLVEVSG